MLKDLLNEPRPIDDDGRVYQYHGPVGVMPNSAIVIPMMEDCPSPGQYIATIVFWPKPLEPTN